MEWISVKERLPELDGHYLCYLDRGLQPGEVRIGDSPFVLKWAIFRYEVTPAVVGHIEKVPCWDAKSWRGEDISKYITHWAQLSKPATDNTELNFTYPVSINGKVMMKIGIPVSWSRDKVESYIRDNIDVKEIIKGRDIKKIIVVPGLIINIVI